MSPHEIHIYRAWAEAYKKWEWACRTERSIFEREDLFKMYVAARDVWLEYLYTGRLIDTLHFAKDKRCGVTMRVLIA